MLRLKNCLFTLTVVSLPLSHFAQTVPGNNQKDTLPEPYATKSVTNFSDAIGWDNGKTPIAPPGFVVTKYADGLDNPRWMYVVSNGDILVAESNGSMSAAKKVGGNLIGAFKSHDRKNSANRITILRDANDDGIPEVKQTFLTGLNEPFGMLLLGNWLYVANTDALFRFPYKVGQTKITAKGQKIMDLPAGKHNRHWARNIITNAEGTKIYIAIGFQEILQLESLVH